MHCGSTSTTPFSVKDILKLEHHQKFGNYFMVHEATRDRRCNHMNPRAPCAQEKLADHHSAAEEEKFEEGEAVWKLIMVINTRFNTLWTLTWCAGEADGQDLASARSKCDLMTH